MSEKSDAAAGAVGLRLTSARRRKVERCLRMGLPNYDFTLGGFYCARCGYHERMHRLVASSAQTAAQGRQR